MADPKKQNPPQNFCMADALREELQKKGEAVMDAFLPHNNEIQIPHEIHTYQNLKHIESANQRSSRIFGFPSWVFKAVNSIDGKPYVLRRIEETLHSKHFSSSLAPLPEATIWSYVTQIASAIKAIHSAGLAARTIEPSKILLTSTNRIRLNCCAIFDIINYDGGKSLQMFQHDDLIHFGQLLVALACGSLSAVANISKSIEHVSATCSQDLKNVVLFLLSKPSNMKTIDDVLLMIGPRILAEINMNYSHNDTLEEELLKEVRNANVFKMLCLLGFINERPQFDMDPSWSETGDRYLLKLFRDYVFHQVDEAGNAHIDFGHVVNCINKLEAGVNEKVMLMSRDDQSCLIVTYSDLKRCVETAYRALRRY
ncbi:PAB-dependent poly(A)-specific ribonuclease subunit 3 [Dinochytrium kinnereticum]|nr:PAB-dependent poly(A)-specific ribonuclease subunit 3 [Dinochytrium kinnereticum]